MYRPRDSEHTVLRQVIALQLEAFLGSVAEAGDGTGPPHFVEREFREFLTCGVFDDDLVEAVEDRARTQGLPARAGLQLSTAD